MRSTTGLLASLMIGSACLISGAPHGAAPASALAVAAAQEGEGVVLVFRDGRMIPGTVIAETPTNIKVLVTVAGISAEATYEKADIVEIQRGAAVAGGGAKKEEEKKPGKEAVKGDRVTTADTKSVYLVELKGALGRDVSASPLKDIVKDAKKRQPDYLLIKLDMDFVVFGDEVRLYAQFFDQFFAANDLVPVLTDDIQRDSSWTKKPNLVFWVRSAMGGVAFLPFASSDIYYTSDARQGGVGDLGYMYEGVGDEVVREKQRSLRLGMAEGMAGRGGHDPIIIRAMTRIEYVLSYDYVGGKPVYYENSLQGEFLLTDDGDPEKGNADLPQDIVRGRGNDVLQLDAEKAFRLGVSKGTADTIEELASKMGIAHNYVLLENRSKRILQEWADGVSKSELDFRRILRDFQRVQVQGNYQERTAARGTQIRYLKQMMSILDRYGEAIDPREIQGYPEDWGQNLEIIILNIRNAQFADGPP